MHYEAGVRCDGFQWKATQLSKTTGSVKKHLETNTMNSNEDVF